MFDSTTWSVFIAALITALATGLGALPLGIYRNMGSRSLGLANAMAGGTMLAASLALVQEGIEIGLGRTVLGIFIGLVFIAITHKYLDESQDEPLTIGLLEGADARKALMVIGIMTMHSFTEGVAVGVSHGGAESLGVFITAAIALHNIPEGLAISLVLVPRGVSILRAALWSIFSSLPQPLMAVPAFLFVEAFEPFLPAGLGFSAGAMLWMVLAELGPEASEEAGRVPAAFTMILSFAAMMLFQTLLRGGG